MYVTCFYSFNRSVDHTYRKADIKWDILDARRLGFLLKNKSNQKLQFKNNEENLDLTCPYCHCYGILKKWDARKKIKSVTVLWCKNCGFGWQYPYPTEDELRNLYINQGLYHEKIVDETQGGVPERIKKLNELKPEKGNILDIGSGMGHFLMHAQEAGWSVEGVEPRVSASKYCYNNFGINVYNGLFEEWSQKKLYDVITLWDVVEHVHNPFHIMNKSIDMLAPGGLLVM